MPEADESLPAKLDKFPVNESNILLKASFEQRAIVGLFLVGVRKKEVRGTVLQLSHRNFFNTENDIAAGEVRFNGTSGFMVVPVGVASDGAWLNPNFQSGMGSKELGALRWAEHRSAVWWRFSFANQSNSHSLKGRAYRPALVAPETGLELCVGCKRLPINFRKARKSA